MSNNALLVRALFGDDMPVADTARNRLLRAARRTRALRSWVAIGCYAYWRLTDDLKTAQRALMQERIVRGNTKP